MSRVAAEPQHLDWVRAILRAQLPEPGVRVWVFGSRARATAKRYADLDLAIDAGRPLSQDERLALAEAFDLSDLPFKVDLVDLQSVRAAFAAAIRAELVPLDLR